MGSDLRYSLINTFTAIDSFRQNVLFNLQGASRPGFNKKNTQLALISSLVQQRVGEAGGGSTGSKPSISVGPSELRVGQSSFAFQQGTIGQRGGQLTSVAINGEGFFAVAEGLQPGARIFLTREGSFLWKETTPAEANVGGQKERFKQFHLANRQGLFVLRAQDVDLDPTSKTFLRLKTSQPPAGLMINTHIERDGKRLIPAGSSSAAGDWIPERIKGIIGFTGDPFKMTEVEKRNPLNNDSDLAIMRVPLKEFLQESSFGATVYETTVASRAGIVGKSYSEWVRRGDGVQVQSESAETPDFTAITTESNIQSDVANFVFKNLRDLLDNYNRSIDDLLSLIR